MTPVSVETSPALLRVIGDGKVALTSAPLRAREAAFTEPGRCLTHLVAVSLARRRSSGPMCERRHWTHRSGPLRPYTAASSSTAVLRGGWPPSKVSTAA